VEELAIDPSPALQRLERAILSQDPGLELVAPAGQHWQGEEQPSVAGQQPQISNLPARNLAFTGRDRQLATLRQRLAASTPAVVVQPQALHGLGGVGKTQLALEHAHRHHGDYDLVWWVAAGQPASIPAQLVTLARRLGIAEYADQAETIQRLWDSLRQRDRWLLVFDNADHPSDLQPWWPPGSGRVIVTSRHPTWGGLAIPVKVDVLSRAEAIAFLQRRLGSDDPALGRLAEALGDLPLALEQAAAYLEETASPATAYLQLLGDRARELLALGHPTTTEQRVATVWRVALDRLRRQTPAAEDLLVLLAFLSADDIPRDLPTQHPGLLPPRLRATVEDPLAYQQTVAALRMLALVTASKDGEQLNMHRLVQAVVRYQLDPEQHQQWAAAALRLVDAAFPPDHTNPDAWPTYARLLPHALAVTGTTDAAEAEPAVAAGLLNNAGMYLWQRAEDQQARTLHERALSIREAHLGADHPDTAWSLDNLALVLAAQGDLQGARTLHERALAIREARLGADHPDTANSLHNLATVLRDQGDLQAARTLQERALAIFEARRGADHPDTAHNLDNLADVLHAQGDLDHARTLHERALHVHEARLGADHPTAAISLDNLATVLRDQGDLDRARILHERALAIFQARLGPDHPTTALSLNNLAGVLAAQGDLGGAQTLYERALTIREARLGPDHPATAWSLNNLALVSRDQGDLQGARPLFERALGIYEACLGADHPFTVRSRERLAAVVAALENRH
jgi:tetratricopeptide (TPR) repeat protein